MKPKPPSKRDENAAARDLVRRSTEARNELPADLEAAWADWSKRIKGVDERTRTLLRAAFDAGAEAARR